MLTNEVEKLKVSVGLLRTRANKLRWGAKFTLGLVILILSIGISLFLYAGEMANREASQSQQQEIQTVINFLKDKREYLVNRMRSQEEKIQELRNKLLSEISGNNGSEKMGAGPISKMIEHNLKVEEEEIYRTRHDISKTDNEIQTFSDSVIAKAESKESMTPQKKWQLITVSTTRLGCILLIIFLVKILLPLYRYNILLAGYYDARADAIELLDINKEIASETLFDLIKILTPDSVNFDSSAQKAPSDEVFNLLGKLIDKNYNDPRKNEK